jgi:hypothetical protein
LFIFKEKININRWNRHLFHHDHHDRSIFLQESSSSRTVHTNCLKIEILAQLPEFFRKIPSKKKNTI